MASVGAILGFITALITLALEWLRRNPKKTETPTEEALARRKRHLEAKLRFSTALGKGDSGEIKKQLDATLDELNNMRQLREASKTRRGPQ